MNWVPLTGDWVENAAHTHNEMLFSHKLMKFHVCNHVGGAEDMVLTK